MNKKIDSKIISIYNRFFISIVTFILIAIFLTGKIIPIPHGTHKGGIISGVGVLIIMITMFIVSVGVNLLINKRKQRPKK